MRDFNKKYNTSTNLRRDKKGKWTVVLNLGTTYRFYLRESKRPYANLTNWMNKSVKAENTALYLFIYEDKKINYLGSTYENGEAKCYFEFECKQSGFYYIKINYIGEKPIKRLYVRGVLAFKSNKD